MSVPADPVAPSIVPLNWGDEPTSDMQIVSVDEGYSFEQSSPPLASTEIIPISPNSMQVANVDPFDQMTQLFSQMVVAQPEMEQLQLYRGGEMHLELAATTAGKALDREDALAKELAAGDAKIQEHVERRTEEHLDGSSKFAEVSLTQVKEWTSQIKNGSFKVTQETLDKNKFITQGISQAREAYGKVFLNDLSETKTARENNIGLYRSKFDAAMTSFIKVYEHMRQVLQDVLIADAHIQQTMLAYRNAAQHAQNAKCLQLMDMFKLVTEYQGKQQLTNIEHQRALTEQYRSETDREKSLTVIKNAHELEREELRLKELFAKWQTAYEMAIQKMNHKQEMTVYQMTHERELKSQERNHEREMTVQVLSHDLSTKQLQSTERTTLAQTSSKERVTIATETLKKEIAQIESDEKKRLALFNTITTVAGGLIAKIPDLNKLLPS